MKSFLLVLFSTEAFASVETPETSHIQDWGLILAASSALVMAVAVWLRSSVLRVDRDGAALVSCFASVLDSVAAFIMSPAIPAIGAAVVAFVLAVVVYDANPVKNRVFFTGAAIHEILILILFFKAW